MNAGFFSANLLAWSVQLLLLIGAGGLLCAAFRITAPRPRLVFLQALLALSLVLPLCAIRGPDAQSGGGQVVVVQHTGVAVLPERTAGFGAAEIVLAIVIAGIVLRLGWLGMGLMRLGRLRRKADRLHELPPAVRSVSFDLRAVAEFYVSDQISGPVTFGSVRPVVLLPPAFRTAPAEMQRSVVCHELIHLRRADWLFTIAEEIIRGLFWFHPAIWWLLGQIQLTREQVVDAEVIAYTRNRSGYIETLLAMAAAKMHAGVAPAPLFLRKRHLARRVASIQKGELMSLRRLVSSLAGMVPLLAVAAIIGWQAFPLTAAQADPNDSPGVEVVGVGNDGFRLLHRTSVQYPAEALEKQISGYVVARVTVDEQGAVTDARIISGPEPLRAAVLASVLKWHFDPNQRIPSDRSFEVGVRFTAPAISGEAPPTNNPDYITIDSVDVTRLPAALQSQTLSALGQYVGQRTAVRDLEATLKRVDRDLAVAMVNNGSGTILQPVMETEHQLASQPPPGVKRIRVGANIQQANLIEQQMPVYPPEAKQAHLEGRVRFTALIGTDGHIKELQLLSGPPLLANAAFDAVKNWVYRPTLLNGNPIEVITQIDVNFTLSQ